MKALRNTVLIALITTACSSIVGETPIDTGPGTSSTSDSPTSTAGDPASRDCVHFTGSTAAVATGTVAGDALYLSGELFVCAHDVVVVGESNLNEIAAAAQLAAALNGPLLLPEPRLAAELGRLKPERVHIVGDLEVNAPPDAEVHNHDITSAVDEVKGVLGVSTEIRLAAAPDATTIVETVGAIFERNRVVFPQTSPAGTAPPTPQGIDTASVVSGLANPTEAEFVWLVDGADPVEILMSAATGRSIGAATVAYDSDDILGYPEVGVALAGRPQGSIRYVGTVPDAAEWELGVLSSGQQLPGGGFLILPEDEPRRYVAFYGHPETAALGALGEQGPEETLRRMQPFIEAYGNDGRKVIPTFEMLASVASANATDGDYSFEWSIETYEEWVRVADENEGYVILDLQPGRDDFLNQALQYEELLRLPNVGLALDPEWRLAPDQVHLEQIGRVEASEVNLVVDWLADLVRDNGLPQKIIIVHQFREFMIQNRETLKQRPELQMIVQMDGDGTEPQKDATWNVLTGGYESHHWSWGWKNFFDEDEPGPPTPESTMSKVPTPVFVSYQ